MRTLRSETIAAAAAAVLAAPLLRGQEPREIRGADGRTELHWIAEGEAEGRTLDAAKEAAVAAARARLLALRRTTVEREVQQHWREQVTTGRGRRPSGDYAEETQARTVEVVAGELRGSTVLESSAVRRGDTFHGHARVACPERLLLPQRRLTALHARREAVLDDYLALAQGYEVDEPALHELTLVLAWRRFQAPRAALALGQLAFAAQRDADAASWAERAAAVAGDDATAASRATELLGAIRSRVPEVDLLVGQLLAAARQRADPDRITVSRSGGGGKVRLDWQLGGGAGDVRVLKAWVDHELTLNWRYADDGEANVEFSWPPADSSVDLQTLVLWCVPRGDAIWKDLAAVENRSWPRQGEVAAAERMQLRDLLRALIATTGFTAVVDLPVR